MQRIFTIILVCFGASSAWAQAAPALPNASAPIQQLSDNMYAAPPVYLPPATSNAPAPAVQPHPVAPQPQPWDYGQSVTTDIRQMNF